MTRLNASRIFTAADYGLSYQGFGGFQIPRKTTAVFEVSLAIGYNWEGNTLSDEIKADFADDNLGYKVECRLVVLQSLTAPPVMAAAVNS